MIMLCGDLTKTLFLDCASPKQNINLH